LRAAVVAGLALAATPVMCGAETVRATPQFLLPIVSRAIEEPAGRAGPTPAWIRFCEQSPDECTVDTFEPEIITLDADSWKAIVTVNEQVNAAIIPVTDQDHWGVLDRWDYPDDGMGDCEDIQLLKRRLLVEAGLPRRPMRMTVVADEEGQGHAVLMVRTDRGDFILDNKRNRVLPWQETAYRYVKREGSENQAWVWLGEQIGPVATANQ